MVNTELSPAVVLFPIHSDECNVVCSYVPDQLTSLSFLDVLALYCDFCVGLVLVLFEVFELISVWPKEGTWFTTDL